MVSRRRRIRWSPIAIRDLDEILEHIAAGGAPLNAERLYDQLRRRIDGLAQHPMRCRVVPELRRAGVLEYRELIVAPYRVFFRLTGNTIGIVGVLDGRRDLEAVLVNRVLA